MKIILTTAKREFKKYLSRNFYTSDFELSLLTSPNTIIARFPFKRLRSYDTIIGYHDIKAHVIYTWGYGYYSTTTSKQITQYCNEQNSIRVDIDYMSLDDFIKHYERLTNNG